MAILSFLAFSNAVVSSFPAFRYSSFKRFMAIISDFYGFLRIRGCCSLAVSTCLSASCSAFISHSFILRMPFVAMSIKSFMAPVLSIIVSIKDSQADDKLYNAPCTLFPIVSAILFKSSSTPVNLVTERNDLV